MSQTSPLDGASPLLAAALTGRFLLELALLAATGVALWLIDRITLALLQD